MTDYAALVEADAIITLEADSKEEAREILEESVQTGHLGPVEIRIGVVEDS